jgi:hypothetical protein
MIPGLVGWRDVSPLEIYSDVMSGELMSLSKNRFIALSLDILEIAFRCSALEKRAQQRSVSALRSLTKT